MDASEYSEEDRQKIERWLSHPIDFPQEFRSWLPDFLAVNIPPIPVSHLVGYQQTLAQGAADVVANEGTSSSSYTSLATRGPFIEKLQDGDYLLIYGCVGHDANGRMSPSANGATPSDSEAVHISTGGSITYSGMRAVRKSMQNDNNNTVELFYKALGGSTPKWSHRWLVVVRLAHV